MSKDMICQWILPALTFSAQGRSQTGGEAYRWASPRWPQRQRAPAWVLPATVLAQSRRGPKGVGWQTLVEVVTPRTVGTTGLAPTKTRHYLSSHHGTAAAFQRYVRRHKVIENGGSTLSLARTRAPYAPATPPPAAP